MQKIISALCLFCLMPSLTFAGAWAQKRGKLGIKISYFSLVTDTRFSTGGGLESRCLLETTPDCFRHALPGGVEIPVFSDLEGTAESRAVFLTLTYGILPRLELSAQAGYFNSENNFDVAVPATVPTASEGISDTRFEVKYQYLARGKFAGALSGGVKAPTGEFQRNAFGVSLGEGGWDYQIAHELGVSLWPLPLYANVRLGYRWRAENEAKIDYGDEFLYNAEAGLNLGSRLLIKIAFHGLNAEDDRQNLGLGRRETPGRKVNFFAPSVFWTLQGFVLETGIEHALSGQNYISGTKLNFGIYHELQIF